MIIAEQAHIYYPKSYCFSIDRTLFSNNSIGILNAEWTVYPCSSKVAAMPLVAVDIIFSSSANKVDKILLIIKVLPVPPGADKNNTPGILFFTLSMKD